MTDAKPSSLDQARAAFERHDPDQALSILRKVLTDDGQNLAALELHYRIASSRQMIEEARDDLARIIALDPGADWAYNDLIRLLYDHGNIAGAERLARVALRANPRNAGAHVMFGTLLSEKGELPPGEWHFRRALDLAPQDTGAQTNLALNLMQQGRTDEAGCCYEEADRAAPDNVAILSHWSKLMEVCGNLPQAARLLDRAAALSSEARVDLLRSRLQRRTGKYREALELLEGRAEMNGDGHLERGWLYDREGRFDAAWRDFVAGKCKLSAQAGNPEYQSAAVGTFFGRLAAFFAQDNLQLLPQAAVRDDVPQPLFVLGFPRSGTTLVEQILASHPAVHAGGELPFVAQFRDVTNRLFPDDGPFPENLSRTWTADGHYVATLFRDLYLARAGQARLLSGGHRLFVDKMPFNEIYLPLIRMAFPASPIVQIVRHPLDVCVSMMSHNFTHGFNCGYRLADIVAHLCAVFDLCSRYRAESGFVPFTVRYENLVADQENTTRTLLGHAGLDFNEACLRFHENRRYAPTPSYAQVTEKLNDRSIGRYRHYAGHLEPYLPQLNPMLEAMQYEALP